MTMQRDLRNHFAAILGRDIGLTEEGDVALFERVASWTRDDGWTTSRRIGTTGDSTKACGTADLLDVSGVAHTGEEGTTDFMLSEFFCDFSGDNILSFQYPVNFVATPRSLTPVFVTARARPTTDQRDVSIEVATWDPKGSPAPSTYFSWRCRVPYEITLTFPD